MKAIIVTILGSAICQEFYKLGYEGLDKVQCAASYTDEETETCVSEVDFIENCLIYDTRSECWTCAFGFSLSEDKKKCNPIEDLKCVMQELEGVCAACAGRVKPDYFGRCEGIDTCSENCESCMLGYGCTYCKEGYYVGVDGMENGCLEQTEKLKNCWLGSEKEGCRICRFNFYFDNKECKPQNAYYLEVFPKREAIIQQFML